MTAECLSVATPEQRVRDQNAFAQQAFAILDLHQLDGATGRCAACGRDAPCEAANDAAIVLVELGRWPTRAPRRSPLRRRHG